MKRNGKSPIFSFRDLYFYTHWWSPTVTAFGRNLYISGSGGGRAGEERWDGKRNASLFAHKTESKGSEKGSRSVIGHIDLTFIVHLSHGN